MEKREGGPFGAAKRVRARSFEENSNAFVGAAAYGEGREKKRRVICYPRSSMLVK